MRIMLTISSLISSIPFTSSNRCSIDFAILKSNLSQQGNQYQTADRLIKSVSVTKSKVPYEGESNESL